MVAVIAQGVAAGSQTGGAESEGGPDCLRRRQLIKKAGNCRPFLLGERMVEFLRLRVARESILAQFL
jgi:hypothetical protein